MGLNYHNLKKHRRNFLDITGLKVEEFEKIVEKVRPFQKKHNLRFNIIAGIVNLRHGF
ncbi:hypothetical protein IYZ83_004595 [Wolbachia pipientis]|uniref:hypothetical protein n=1 Tax=Wolbachia pipientis TaxID=955 RepID=UPI001F2C25E3|nr:hypothetical protein [Wolbachia pipientis]UIP91416.1 hypothetical protein IYZ83_004595 [Wolbachia pipientis]